MEKTAAILLMMEILKMVKEAGVNAAEAECALMAAHAMLPDLGLSIRATETYYSVK